MTIDEDREVTGQRQRVRELLLAYLREADAPHWPGADGVTVDDVLASYPQASAAGMVPDLPALLTSHPDLADALREVFALLRARPKPRERLLLPKSGEKVDNDGTP
jgi:hypothetical protein